MTVTKYKPGDRVVATRWPRDGAGVIVKSAPVYPTVRWDTGKEERRRVHDLRPETPEDVVRRDRESAMHRWRERKPKTILAAVVYDRTWARSIAEIGASVGLMRSPDQMRQAASELLELATWFEARPKEDA